MNADPGKKRRRLIGIGFLLAFALSTATIIYTGLNVRAPRSAARTAPEQPVPQPLPEKTGEPSQAASSADPEETSQPRQQP
jgi:hypothetical protein